jgi:uncharacterized protein (DUF1778 family)
MNSKKAGRPKLDPSKVRNVSLLLRITREEKELIESKAKGEGKTVSDWVRRRLVGENS